MSNQNAMHTEKFNRVVRLIVAADNRPRRAAVELAERWADGLIPHTSWSYPYANRRETDEAVGEMVEERATLKAVTK